MAPVAPALSGGAAAQYLIPGISVKLSSDFFSKKRLSHNDRTVLNLAKKTGWANKLQPKVRHLIPDEKHRSLLREKVELAKTLDPTYIPVNFDEWYEIIFEPVNKTEGKTIFGREDAGTPVHPEVEELAKELDALPEVQTAQVRGIMALANVDPPKGMKIEKRNVQSNDDPQRWQQGYLNWAPQGIGADSVWWRAGGDGRHATVTDIEWGWRLTHEEFAGKTIPVVGGANQVADDSHGTPVLGEMIMGDNTVGGVGIAPAANAKVVGVIDSNGWGQSFPTLMTQAIAAAVPGEVILIEIHIFIGVGPYWRAMEVVQENYDAIRLATALGYTVVEPAGNGENYVGGAGDDFDNFTVGGKYILRRGHADFRDSGAIMVAGSVSATPHTKISYTNYGSRMDCYAWAENVFSSAGGANNAYTTTFGGTSSASPIVAGAAMLLQSLNKAKTGSFLTNTEVRSLLSTYGTASAYPTTEKIGLLPDLNAIANFKGYTV